MYALYKRLSNSTEAVYRCTKASVASANLPPQSLLLLLFSSLISKKMGSLVSVGANYSNIEGLSDIEAGLRHRIK